jgi:hypothetical protein
MEQNLIADLDSRIKRLESSIRRDRTIALGVIAFVFATAQSPSTTGAVTAPVVVRDASGASATLEAKGLTFRDAAGHERLFSGIDSGDRPSVDLSDTSGTLRESMYLLDNLPVLRQFDKNGKRRAEFRLDDTENGELLINDESENIRLGLFRAKNGDPQMGLYGSDAKLRAYFSTDNDSPYLVMRDAAANTRVYIGGYTGGKIGMDVRAADGTVLWDAPPAKPAAQR